VGVGAGVGALVAREKKAAMSALTAQGVDFATAAALVNQKSQELYGF
jgi:intracellular sulfur oxidation DsrE/DsrF family protein